jgi:transcription elongation GreA/GreB family factor
MGKALIGRKVGEDVEVVTGERSARYTVVSIG